MTEELTERRSNGIATLTFNRPESRNALTPEMMVGMRAVSYTHLTLPTKRIV